MLVRSALYGKVSESIQKMESNSIGWKNTLKRASENGEWRQRSYTLLPGT